MIVSIHQPSYWPWLGLLDKAAKSDIFVMLDNVQLNKDAFQRRNVFCANGGKKYLTVPIDYSLGIKISEAKIKNPRFPKKHLETLRNWYLKAPYFKNVMEWLDPIYERQYEYLIDILEETMRASIEAFDIKSKVVMASDLDIAGTKGELVLNICRSLDADTYLSGSGAIGYFQEEDYEAFQKAGIDIEFQSFLHPTYSQFNTGTFMEGLGCLDFLFNCGFEKGGTVLREISEKGVLR